MLRTLHPLALINSAKSCLTSILFAYIISTKSAYFLPTSVSVLDVNCDPLGSPATHYSRLPSCSVFIPRTRTISIPSRLAWLSLIIIYSRVSYCYYYLNLMCYVTFNTASYLDDANVVHTVHWIVNPPVPIHYNVYHTVCCLLAH
jgi:hypothetical protein